MDLRSKRPPPLHSPSRCARLLAISSEAADEGHYESAYHALMAALHDAEDSSNVDEVRQVAEVARAQAVALEKLKPAHNLSRAAARARGTAAVYDTFQNHVDSVLLRLESDARRQREKKPAWPE